MQRDRKAGIVIIFICLIFFLSGCSGKDEAVVFQDENLFFGGIIVGMDEEEAVKATKGSMWFDDRLDNYARSVRRAKVDCAEFVYTPLSLSNGEKIIPRISFDKKGDIIFVGCTLLIPSSQSENHSRILESYTKRFILDYNLESLEYTNPQNADTKNIGEKSVFRKATKLFYDDTVTAHQYWFDKNQKTGYAIYQKASPGSDSEISFLQFRF